MPSDVVVVATKAWAIKEAYAVRSFPVHHTYALTVHSVLGGG